MERTPAMNGRDNQRLVTPTTSRNVAPSPAPLPSTLAQLTDTAFLEVLYQGGATSRVAIAKATGISKSTISESAQRLLSAGLIVEVGPASGNRGRSPLLYDVDPHYGHCLGVALELRHVAVRAIDHKGDLIYEEQIDGGNEGLPTAIADARSLIGKCSQHARSPRLATAVSVAAPVDPRTNTVRQLPDAPLTGSVPAFDTALGLTVGEPVVVDNDVNWATLAEHRIGTMTGVDDFLYVYLGVGVGAGLFLSGRLHRGARGTAGEIAFLRMPNGDTLMRRLAHSPIGSTDGRSIDLDRARDLLNRTAADTDTDDLLEDLARSINSVITTVDPGHVVLGGPLAHTARITHDLTTRIHRDALTELNITTSPLGATAALDGTAIAALDMARRRHTAPTNTIDRG